MFPLLRDSRGSLLEAMQRGSVGWAQPGRGDSSSQDCILLVTDFESWSERSLWF